MKRTLLTFVVVNTLGLGLLACGSDDTADTSVGSDPALVDPVDTTVPGDETAMVTPTPGLVNPTPSAIDSASRVTDEKLELRFYNGVPECYGVDRVEVEETDADVTVTVFTGGLPTDEPVACVELAVLQATAVTLEAPLGDRTLIDGSTGNAVPVS